MHKNINILRLTTPKNLNSKIDIIFKKSIIELDEFIMPSIGKKSTGRKSS